MAPLNLHSHKLLYQAMTGVGGIGSGTFFAVSGNDTLGREESRAGRLLDRRDYCKLHIIAHYVKALLGPGFATYPIGRVGADNTGRMLIEEMQAAGLDTTYVRLSPGEQTLFSFCFQYPDGTGGNLTTNDSASDHVTAESVAEAEAIFNAFSGRGIALAAPEVPLETRSTLLEVATAHQFWRVASFVTAEVEPALQQGMIEMVDLVALNLDEAAAAAGEALDRGAAQATVDRAVERLCRLNPQLRVSMTGGRLGSWAWDGQVLSHQPAFDTTVVGTAGAGDAHLAGVIAGEAVGLSFAESHQLAGLVAGLSVQSPHTIHKGVDRLSLRQFAEHQTLPISVSVRELLASSPDS